MRAQLAWDIAEGGDAQMLRQGLQLLVFGRQAIQVARERDIVADHPRVSIAPHLSNRHPHFEGTKAARVLRSPLVEVGRGIVRSALEPEVRGMKAERRA